MHPFTTIPEPQYLGRLALAQYLVIISNRYTLVSVKQRASGSKTLVLVTRAGDSKTHDTHYARWRLQMIPRGTGSGIGSDGTVSPRNRFHEYLS